MTVLFTTQADNVTAKLMEVMAPGVQTNLDDFVTAIQKDVNFRPYGDLLHCYKVHIGKLFCFISAMLLPLIMAGNGRSSKVLFFCYQVNKRESFRSTKLT